LLAFRFQIYKARNENHKPLQRNTAIPRIKILTARPVAIITSEWRLGSFECASLWMRESWKKISSSICMELNEHHFKAGCPNSAF
jgi:hypothetical protein